MQSKHFPTEHFSYETRRIALERFRTEKFDLLIIGGGITGAATARDAVSRGLKVALVEKNDFAFGTSSRSSKLIHGGLRYLEQMEFPLVFESLAERKHLIKTVPNLVKPLQFYFPIYKQDRHSKSILSLGLWLYDLLALFRTPGFHKKLSKTQMLKAVTFLNEEGLNGGFRYFDASMWDDLLVVETLRSAKEGGACVANYVEADKPLWDGDRIKGFQVVDCENRVSSPISLKAKKVIVCAGPWTDKVGEKLSSSWQPWLRPSKGIHLVFDLKKFPVPGAVVMNRPNDGRVAFVIPRPDFGEGVALVGTTDGPTPQDPEQTTIDESEIDYLINLVGLYFPHLNLTKKDIMSAYVGVRPLMDPVVEQKQTDVSPSKKKRAPLQKVSREHYIGRGPGGVVLVCGGKYTTHRTMAVEIVDYTLDLWEEEVNKKLNDPLPAPLGLSKTGVPLNLKTSPEALLASQKKACAQGLTIPEELIAHYGADALEILEIKNKYKDLKGMEVPKGFPFLAAELRYALRTGMVVHLEDFYLRRSALYLARADHGLPWAEALSLVWAEERGLGEAEACMEVERLKGEIEKRDGWRCCLSE